MKSFIKAVAGAALALATVSSTASAQFSLVNFDGSVLVSETGGGTGLLLNFNPVIQADNTISGIFAPEITPATFGTISDVAVGAGGCTNCPINGFVSLGGYTFNLISAPPAPPGPFNFGPVQLTQSTTGTTASFGVTGTFTGPDAPMGGNFSGLFTAQFTGETPAQVFESVQGSQTRTVTFSAEFAATTVPEPSTYVLMAAGLAALGVVARRRRTA